MYSSTTSQEGCGEGDFVWGRPQIGGRPKATITITIAAATSCHFSLLCVMVTS